MTGPLVWRFRHPALLIFVLTTVGCEAPDQGAANAIAAPNDNSAVSGVRRANQGTQKPLGLMLSGDGLLAVARPDGPTRTIAFGSAQSSVIESISSFLGTPDQEGDNEECPAGPVHFASWSKGLMANFQDNKFVGWGGAVDLRTARNIGFGSTRAQLDKAYDPTIEESSLGVEFSAEELSGILESTAADAAITEIWAGVTCVAR
jgi:hypothetical protein